MFGELNPRLKGGFSRLQQSLVGATNWLKGSSNADLTISAGDGSSSTTVASTAPALNLLGGSNALAGVSPVSAAQSGGAVNITGGLATTQAASLSFGGAVNIAGGLGVTGGAVNINGGGSANTTNGAVNITGGQTSGGSANGAAVTITGGSSGNSGGNGGKVTIQAGTTVTGGGAANLELLGGNGSGNPGNVLIRGGTSSGANGNIQLDGGRGAALSTSATGGFVTIPTCAGTPSGTPANVPTGSVPIVFDTTGVKLWAYTGGAWKGVVLS